MSKPNIIFIPNINLGNGRATSYHYSVKSWKNWANNHNVQVVEWTEPILDPGIFPIIMQREWVLDILDNSGIEYDQVLIVDADTIVHPNCPDFFAMTDHQYAAIRHNGCYEWVNRSIKQWGDALFPDQPYVKNWDYITTGFVILNEKHKPFLKEIQTLFLTRGEEIKVHRDRIKASTGQTIVNYMLNKNKIDITYLPERYNLQDLFRKNLLHIPGHSWFSDELHFLDCGWVYHFNAIPTPQRNASYWIERTYKELYG